MSPRAISDKYILYCLLDYIFVGEDAYLTDGKMLLYDFSGKMIREYEDPSPKGVKGEYPSSPDFWTANFFPKELET